LQIANEIGYLKKQVFENLDKECEELGRMIGKLIKVRAGTYDS